MQIEVIVREKIARLANKQDFAVCGNSDYTIKFNFDSEWDDYETKTARFKYNGTYTDVVFNGNECPMPIIINAFRTEIGVYVGDLHTTTSAILPMRKSILCGDEVEAKGSLVGSNEIIEAIEKTNEEQIQSVTQIVNNGYNQVVSTINDMYGEVRTVLCTVTSADISENGVYKKKYDDQITISNNTYFLERITEDNVTYEYEYESWNNAYFGNISTFYIGYEYDAESDSLIPFDGISVYYEDFPDGVTLEVVKVDVKKIPIEYIDTTDIENTVYSIVNEVNSL